MSTDKEEPKLSSSGKGLSTDQLLAALRQAKAAGKGVRNPTDAEAASNSPEKSDEREEDFHMLFSESKISKCLAGSNEETRELLGQMRRAGAYRSLARVPPNFQEIAEGLEQAFPNFSSYVREILLPSLALSHLSQSALRLDPVLFLGPPGVGKTLFAAELSARFGLDFSRVNTEAGTTSFALVGLPRGYSNAAPGQLFRWLAGEAKTANGVMIIEELDKAGAGDHRFPVLNTLLQLLEPTTASEFGDQSVPELKLDLTRLNFLFTANSLDGISEPILSRMLIVDIPSLTPQQAQGVAMRQYEKLIQLLNLPIAVPKITQEGLEILGRESPRRQRLLLQLAVGRAVLEKSASLAIRRHEPPSRSSIGFV